VKKPNAREPIPATAAVAVIISRLMSNSLLSVGNLGNIHRHLPRTQELYLESVKHDRSSASVQIHVPPLCDRTVDWYGC
jgi:hypothetical protein